MAADTLGLSRLALSVEPYAVMVRKGDTALLAADDRSLAQLYASGGIHALYDSAASGFSRCAGCLLDEHME